MTRHRQVLAVHIATATTLCGSIAASTASILNRAPDLRITWAAAVTLLCAGAILLCAGIFVDRTPVAKIVRITGGIVMMVALVAIVVVAASGVRVTAGVAAILGAPLLAGGSLALAGIAADRH